VGLRSTTLAGREASPTSVDSACRRVGLPTIARMGYGPSRGAGEGRKEGAAALLSDLTPRRGLHAGCDGRGSVPRRHCGVPVSVAHTESPDEIRIISFRRATGGEAKRFFAEVQD
jgi:hypothetical protein